jgi:hypothetical protein
MRVKIQHEGRVIQDVQLGPSASDDGTIATKFQEFDRRDEDTSERRYRKKVTRAGGLVVKDVDVRLTNQEAHGPVRQMRDPESRPPPGDPMHVKLAFQ